MKSMPLYEQHLIRAAKTATSDARWLIGNIMDSLLIAHPELSIDELATAMAGPLQSAEQVAWCYEIWRYFGDVRDEYPNLTWSHFDAAYAWDDDEEALDWANEHGESVEAMRAWRAAKNGNDSTKGDGP